MAEALEPASSPAGCPLVAGRALQAGVLGGAARLAPAARTLGPSAHIALSVSPAEQQRLRESDLVFEVLEAASCFRFLEPDEPAP